MADTVQVAVRIRPLSGNELEQHCQNCLEVAKDEPQISVIPQNQHFTYNYVFTPSNTQEEVYSNAVKQLILKLFKGYNVTILAYGQTGSGKTYSMGTVYSGEHNKGIIPRSIQDIFHYVAEKSEDWNFTISVSFMELYQEQVYDLLSQKSRDQSTVDIREDSKGIYLPGLTELPVHSEMDTINCLQRGSSNRATGATAMNAESSRSHAIFSIIIKQESKSEKSDTMTSKFHLVDLAGSERSKKTKATGERFKEGVNINKGLLALGNVIEALGKGGNSYISYRDSKLTRILQDSLGGNSVTMMIACVSPASFNREETLSTLRYADRAKRIKNKPIINKDSTIAEIGSLKKEIAQLKEDLLKAKALGVDSCPPEHGELKLLLETSIKKNKILAEALNDAILQSTNLFERAQLAETSRDRMKDKISAVSNEVKSLEVILDSLGEDEKKSFLNFKQTIFDLQAEQKRSEEEIVKHEISGECNSKLQDTYEQNDSHCVGSVDDAEDQVHEELIMSQAKLNKELSELNKQLALKMELASTLTASAQQIDHIDDENNVKQLEAQIATLQHEKDELLRDLKSAQANIPSKLAEQRRKRLQELEQLIVSLRQKVSEQASIIKMKESQDKKIVNLNSEIKAMKQSKVRLIQQMKFESERFRQWKTERERELCRLRTQDRRRQNELIRLENKHNKQQNVMKRKMEQTAAMNKRLKEALAVQKSVQERRHQNALNGKTEKLQSWINNELEILTGTIQTQKTLEQLIGDKKSIEQNLEILRETLCYSDLTAQERQKLTLEIRQNQEDLDLRTAQIIDLEEKITELDQERKVKAKFDAVTSLFDAKSSLKHLFDICVDLKKDTISKDFKLQELKDSILDCQNRIKVLEQDLEVANSSTQAQLTALEKEYEDKILVLLSQLRDKDISISAALDSANLDTQLTERLKISNELVAKMKTLRQEYDKKEEECLNLREQVKELQSTGTKNKSMNRSKSTSSLHSVSEVRTTNYVELSSSEDEDSDDDKNDPDWRKTPLFRRLQKLKRKEKETKNLKRKTGSQENKRCNCKVSCKTRCSCVKINSSCSDLCKCNGACDNGTQALPTCSRNLSSELEYSDEYNSSGANENNPNLDNTYVCDDSSTVFKKPRLDDPLAPKMKYFS